MKTLEKHERRLTVFSVCLLARKQQHLDTALNETGVYAKAQRSDKTLFCSHAFVYDVRLEVVCGLGNEHKCK